MKIADLQNMYAQQMANIEKLAHASNLWQAEARDVLARAGQDLATDDFIQLLHEVQRLNKIGVAGLENDAAFRAAVLKENLPMWRDFTTPPVDHSLQLELAKKIYNIRPGMNDVGILRLDQTTREIGKWLVEKCQADNAPFVAMIYDPSFDALVVNHTTEEGIKALAADLVRTTTPATRSMIVFSGTPDVEPLEMDKDKKKLYMKEISPYNSRSSTGSLFYTLTDIPSPKDAAIDGIEYQQYLQLFFEMCDQPWDEISKAHKGLIAEFNKASQVRITNSDGTDVTMSLIDNDGSHFTFCNSLIAKNVPGSEIFSAPRRDSVEGVVVAKGRFEHSGKVIENLRMEFKKGKMVNFSAEKGQADFAHEVSIDEGALYVGELGIGTNPHLKQHVMNGLLVEKIGGSFHLALGRPYSYTEYGGEEVKVNNGGVSDLHWDITTMLHGKDGKIYLDGRQIMDNGKWVAPEYDVLNRGWESIPEDKRPAYWKNYYKNKSPGM